MKREFVVNRDGKDFVLYAGLLDLAHEHGLQRITTHLLQVPNGENGNVAIVHATVALREEMEAGPVVREYQGLGDASPNNVTRLMAPHLIRMAETRAKARALRDAVNIGMVALEELVDGDDGDADLGPGTVPARTPRPATAPVPRPAAQVAPRPRAVEPPQDDAPFPGAEGPGSWPGHEGSGEAGDVPPDRARSYGPQRSSGGEAGGPPATPKQLETIERMSRAAGKSIVTDGLNRAQASEIISQLIAEMGAQRG